MSKQKFILASRIKTLCTLLTENFWDDSRRFLGRCTKFSDEDSRSKETVLAG